MTTRRSEKLGWILGWTGGFVWVAMLSVASFSDGRRIEAAIGGVLVGVAGLCIALVSPWRFPTTSYRLLMTPLCLLLAAALAWSVWLLEDPRSLGFQSWWSALVLLPVLIPFATVGSRRWIDGG